MLSQCSKCGLSKSTGPMGSVLPQCQCDWKMPNSQRTWVGLTRDEQSFVYSNLHNATSREDSFWVDFAQAIEAKLKEKNNG